MIDRSVMTAGGGLMIDCSVIVAAGGSIGDAIGDSAALTTGVSLGSPFGVESCAIPIVPLEPIEIVASIVTARAVPEIRRHDFSIEFFRMTIRNQRE